MIGKFDFNFLLLFRIIKPDKIPGIPDILSGYNIYGYCPPMSITDYKGNITESQRLKIEQCAINILYYRSFPICKGSESRFFFENATEITRVIESHICGNLSNRQIFIFKLSLCLFYALVQYIFPDTDALCPREKVRKIIFICKTGFRDCVKRYFITEIFVDKLQGNLHSLSRSE